MPHIKAIRRYCNAGLSSAPVTIVDKYPKMLPTWKQYQSAIPTENEIKSWQSSYRDADKYGCCIFCGAVSGGLVVIDIDNHLGNAKEIFEQLINIDEVANIIQYCPIETTRNGGYHIFFKVDNPCGNLKLSTQQKKTVIETRGEGGLIVCAPTSGYELMQGSLIDIPRITDEDMQSLFEFCAMFNDVEIEEENKKVNHHNQEYDGIRPGDWYNENGIEDSKVLLKKHGWEFIKFVAGRELWRRPGKNNGVSATFGYVAPHIFYPYSGNSAPFEERKCYSPFYIKAILEHNNDYSATARAIIQEYNLKPSQKKTTNTTQKQISESPSLTPTEEKPNDFIQIKNVSTSSDDKDFWYFGGKDGTKFCIDYFLLKRFLERYGFFRYEINKDKFAFLKIVDNIAEMISFETIRDFILNHLSRMDEHDIYNKFCDSSKFNEKTISIVGSVDIKWMSDTKTECFLFFQNGFTKTTESGTTLHPYTDMKGVIWKSQQLERSYDPSKEIDLTATYPYRFCGLVSAWEETRINAYMSALGYLSHTFKQESSCPLIIFCDENDTDEPWGGTGKGMSAKFVSHVRNLVSLDGKSFDSKERFAMQRVNQDTNVILLDDLDRGFKLEKIFSKITDGITISKLYLGEIYIKFKDSPKWAATSNYIIKGSESSSFERRLFAIEIHRFFTPKHTPDQEFDKSFFHEWNEDDYQGFDYFMHECIRLWLAHGLIKPNYVTIDRNKLKANTSTVFAEWAEENLKNDSRYFKSDLFEKFKNDVRDPWINKNLAQNTFTRWVRFYCDYKKYTSDVMFGSGNQWIIIGNPTVDEMSRLNERDEPPF